MGVDDRRRTRAHPAACGASPARAQRHPRPSRNPRYRQADLGNRSGRCRHRRGRARILCRAVPEPGRHATAAAGDQLLLYATRADRRRGRNRRLELPDPDRALEIRSGAGSRQRDDLQAQRDHPAQRHQARRDLQRGRTACGRVQRRPGQRSGCRAAAHRPCRDRQDLVHRRRRDRQDGDGAGGRLVAEGRDPGARRARRRWSSSRMPTSSVPPTSR